MKNNWDKILDECIDRINRGEGIEGCLTDYPEYREELGPLLPTILDVKRAYSFTPSVRAKNFYIANGNTNKQVAHLLGISNQTIKTHVSALLRKLNANDRAHAVALDIQNQSVSVDIG